MYANNATHLDPSPILFPSTSTSSADISPASFHQPSDDDWDHLSDQVHNYHIDNDKIPATTAELKPPIKFRHVEPREAQTTSARRDTSRHRVPVPAPDVPKKIPSDPPYGGARRRQQPRRSSSEISGSVGSHEDYPGFDPRIPNPGPQQWSYGPQQPSQYQPSIASQTYSHQPPMQVPPGPALQHMVSYAQPDPWAYYAPNPFAPPYAYSQAPSVASHSAGYFPDPRGPIQGYNMPVMPYGHQMPYPYPSPPLSVATDDKKMDRLEEFLVQQERARVARDEARERRLEAERAAAEARAAREAEERQQAEALASAAKNAKEEAETKAAAREAESEKKHKEAMEAAKKKLDAAKAAEEAAKKEAEAHKPSDDSLMGPIKFQDAVGRKFSFPWKICKTWKGMEFLINQAFEPVPNLAHRVRDRNYDLAGPDGEIILPSVWENTVKPEWLITMTMWPLPEPKGIVEPPRPAPMPMPVPTPLLVPMDPPRRSKSKNEHRRGHDFHALPPPPMMGPPMMPEYPMAMNSLPPLGMKMSSERKKGSRTPQVAMVNGRKVMVRRQ